jgi:DNA-binding Xre family transcriptional regulator
MDQQLILKKIQEMLKVKGITYLALSEKMSLSHATIKRIFSKQQITFENLVKICDFLDISLSDLFYEVEQENLKAFRFTTEQELFFASHPNYLAYFYQIRAKKTPAQIRSQFSLSEKSNSKYLKKLKSFGLIRLEGSDYVSSIKLPLAWDDDGPLGRVFSQRMITDLVARASTPGTQPKKTVMDLKNFVLSKTQYEDYGEELRSLAEKYQSISSQNSKLKRKTNTAVTSLIIVGERQFSLFEDIPEI